MLKFSIIIYFTISITSILRDYVDTQCDLNIRDIFPMFFVVPLALIYCVMDKIHDTIKKWVTNA